MLAPAPIIVQNLAVSRGDRRLLRAINQQLKGGELVHLTGRNGIGKTSLLEALAGLRQPESGSVQGLDSEKVHWLGHKNALSPALTPIENLEFWCGLAGADVRSVRPALERLHLGPAVNRPVRVLSTGQKRRSALARLLLQPRAWWLLDEPFAGLDTDGVGLLAQLIAGHTRAGGGVLMTSHQALPTACGAVREWRLSA
jgi:heme exporter protein A